jgi:hypothetical protein
MTVFTYTWQLSYVAPVDCLYSPIGNQQPSRSLTCMYVQLSQSAVLLNADRASYVVNVCRAAVTTGELGLGAPAPSSNQQCLFQAGWQQIDGKICWQSCDIATIKMRSTGAAWLGHDSVYRVQSSTHIRPALLTSNVACCCALAANIAVRYWCQMLLGI